MKNKNFAKKILLVAAITSGSLGYESAFSQMQSYGVGYFARLDHCKNLIGETIGFGTSCLKGSQACQTRRCGY